LWIAIDEINQSVAKCMRWISNSTKALVKKAGPSAVMALLGVAAFYLIASNGFTRRTVAPSVASTDVPGGRVEKESQGAPAGGNDKKIVTSGSVGQEANEAHPRATSENNSAVEQTPAPGLTPSAVPVAEPKTFATDSEFLEKQPPETERKSLERPPSEPTRKTLERRRAEAERQRARLEKLYQKHLISSEAYKKGEEKYKTEIEKYRSAVNGGKVPKTQVPEV
jgi:hypothetical protein